MVDAMSTIAVSIFSSSSDPEPYNKSGISSFMADAMSTIAVSIFSSSSDPEPYNKSGMSIEKRQSSVRKVLEKRLVPNLPQRLL
jgi:hypothetical protein